MPMVTDTNKPIRRYAFYVAVVVTIAVAGVVMSPFLPHIVTGWTGSFGSQSIYALVIVAGMWTRLLGMAVQFYRPTERVNAILWMPFGLLLSGTIGLATGTEMLRDAFPDMSVTTEDLIAEGDKVVLQKCMLGKNQEEPREMK